MDWKNRLFTACLNGAALAFIALFSFSKASAYQVGSGIYDITGPAAELAMLGYGKLDQVSAGIHQRLRARAFVFVDESSGKRIAYVSADLPMMTRSVHQGVLAKLAEELDGLYTQENTMLSATHTHSGPGGYTYEPLYNITTLGFSQQNYDVIVEGITAAVKRAHNNLTPGHIYYDSAQLVNASKNRSIEAYENNPQAERAQYFHPFDTQMDLLKLTDAQGKELGLINWFPLHAVSMSNRNRLISGDNKGYAAYLFEQDKNTDYQAEQTFVAAFAQGNEGDVSPNIDQDEDDINADEMARTEAEGRLQYDMARSIYAEASKEIKGEIDYRFAYVDMDDLVLDKPDKQGQVQTTCVASLGYAFAAGCSDGRGSDIFKEGQLNHLPMVDLLTSVIAKPSKKLAQCQAPKPILLPTGQTKPTPWTSDIVPIQLLKLGKIVLVGVPGEFTTMAGRRLRQQLVNIFPKGTQVIISGLSNGYSGYVTTKEEYQIQHYEGGHTLFGPNTHQAYVQEFSRLANDMVNEEATELGSPPPFYPGSRLTLQTPVIFDGLPKGKSFGEVLVDAKPFYRGGSEVEVIFWAGHPKNNLRTQGSFLRVERQVKGGWETVADDGDWETTYQWQRYGHHLAYSTVKVTWRIPKFVKRGTYRIVHEGDAKNLWDGKISAYQGESSNFSVFPHEE